MRLIKARVTIDVDIDILAQDDETLTSDVDQLVIRTEGSEIALPYQIVDILELEEVGLST